MLRYTHTWRVEYNHIHAWKSVSERVHYNASYTTLITITDARDCVPPPPPGRKLSTTRCVP
eukprot:42431-Eustigmatos_ZCMA.PRE.1